MNTPIKKFKDIIPTQQEVGQEELDSFVNMFYDKNHNFFYKNESIESTGKSGCLCELRPDEEVERKTKLYEEIEKVKSIYDLEYFKTKSCREINLLDVDKMIKLREEWKNDKFSYVLISKFIKSLFDVKHHLKKITKDEVLDTFMMFGLASGFEKIPNAFSGVHATNKDKIYSSNNLIDCFKYDDYQIIYNEYFDIKRHYYFYNERCTGVNYIDSFSINKSKEYYNKVFFTNQEDFKERTRIEELRRTFCYEYLSSDFLSFDDDKPMAVLHTKAQKFWKSRLDCYNRGNPVKITFNSVCLCPLFHKLSDKFDKRLPSQVMLSEYFCFYGYQMATFRLKNNLLKDGENLLENLADFLLEIIKDDDLLDFMINNFMFMFNKYERISNFFNYEFDDAFKIFFSFSDDIKLNYPFIVLENIKANEPKIYEMFLKSNFSFFNEITPFYDINLVNKAFRLYNFLKTYKNDFQTTTQQDVEFNIECLKIYIFAGLQNHLFFILGYKQIELDYLYIYFRKIGFFSPSFEPNSVIEVNYKKTIEEMENFFNGLKEKFIEKYVKL
ncbi:hypothetical protein [Campylobacter sp. RM12647]|uniref:hypothetical protein n=1 Tax=Campylobacter sp. RM12647 TaxID=2735737 RepID=UPI001D2F5165|nr:hypothetical protein [Campylobacter sp. RM12647]